jgi:hypothetical protein
VPQNRVLRERERERGRKKRLDEIREQRTA